MNYYVYAYLRKDGTPYYIGKGKGNRAWANHFRGNGAQLRPNDLDRIIIVERNLTEIGSMALERRLIRWYGRKDNHTGILRNLTDGGDGVSGFTHSLDTRKKLQKASTGRVHTSTTRAKMSASRMGKSNGPHTEEVKQLLSSKLSGDNNPFKGKTHTDEAKRLIGLAASQRNKGLKRTDEQRARISQGHRNRKATGTPSPLKGRKLGPSPLKGRKLSEETKQKMRGPRKKKLDSALS